MDVKSFTAGFLCGLVTPGRLGGRTPVVTWVDSGTDVTGDHLFRYDNGFVCLDVNYTTKTTRVLTSNDGKVWEEIVEIPVVCSGFVYGNGVYIAYGNAERIYISDNLEAWTQVTVPTLTENADSINSFMFYNGVFVITPFHTGLTPYYSVDGINWTQSELPASRYSLHFCNGRLFASGGDKYFSHDGISWTMVNEDANMTRPQYGGGVYIASTSKPDESECEYYYSTDGISWSKKIINGTIGSSMWVFRYCNGLWFAFQSENGLYCSADGLNWDLVADAVTDAVTHTGAFFDMVYGGGKWVTSSPTMYSYDGHTWHRSSEQLDTTPLAYFDGVFLGDLYYSLDGVIWRKAGLDGTITALYGSAELYHNGVVVKRARKADGKSTLAYCELQRS